jgi:hypothetical protein
MSKRAKHAEKQPLSPAQRSLQARLAAHVLHARYSAEELLAKAHYEAHVGRYEREVDPDGTLSAEERARRVESAKKAHMTRLALASSRARAERKQAAS